MITQADVAAFLPYRRAHRGLAIVEHFDVHIELLCKSWVLNNLMSDCLRTSSFLHLDVTDLYAICMHLKFGWEQEFWVCRGNGLVYNVGVWVTRALRL